MKIPRYAKYALETMFRAEAGYFIGDDVTFCSATYRFDGFFIKDGLVGVNLRKLKADGTPSMKHSWEWLSAGIRAA